MTYNSRQARSRSGKNAAGHGKRAEDARLRAGDFPRPSLLLYVTFSYGIRNREESNIGMKNAQASDEIARYITYLAIHPKT